METIEITTNLEELDEKVRNLKKAIKEINDFKFKGVFKKEKKVIEYSTNLEEFNKKITLLKKLISQVNSFRIKAKTKMKKSI